MKYILVFEQMGYAECGGGTYFENFTTLAELDFRVNEILSKGQAGCECKLVFAGEVAKTFNYEPVEKVTVFERSIVTA